MLNPTLEYLAKEWIKLFEKKPLMTAIGTLVSAVLLGSIIFFVDSADKHKREVNRLNNLTYQTQIQQLNDTEKNIRQLLDFVENQKYALRETQDTISMLQKERDKLKPIVETDRAVVEAIFKSQEERNHASIWRERWIGFGLGVVASLIATFIWFVISLLLKRRHNHAMQRIADNPGAR